MVGSSGVEDAKLARAALFFSAWRAWTTDRQAQYKWRTAKASQKPPTKGWGCYCKKIKYFSSVVAPNLTGAGKLCVLIVVWLCENVGALVYMAMLEHQNAGRSNIQNKTQLKGFANSISKTWNTVPLSQKLTQSEIICFQNLWLSGITKWNANIKIRWNINHMYLLSHVPIRATIHMQAWFQKKA